MSLTCTRTPLLWLAGMLVLAAAVAASSAGCSGPMNGELGSQPDFTGWVTAIEPGPGGGALGSIVVESQADKIVRRLVVTVTSETRIQRREAGATRQAAFVDVALRDQARLWLAGPVPRSFPARVTARQLVVERLY